MGYHTHYCGELTVDPPMTPEHLELFKRVAHGTTDVFAPLTPELEAISGYFGSVLADAAAASDDTIDINGEGYMDFQDHLKQIISVFFEPLGYKVSGEFDWDGDDSSDKGTVYIKENQIEWVGDNVENPGPSWDRRATAEDMKKALEGVLHHNDATKDEYKLPESLIRHIKTALKVS